MKQIKPRDEALRNFTLNPKLKELMINYYGITHEVSATNYDLMTEYNWLLKNNKLHLIFECEQLANIWNGPGVHSKYPDLAMHKNKM